MGNITKYESKVSLLEVILKRILTRISAIALILTCLGFHSCSQSVDKLPAILEKSFTNGSKIEGFEFFKERIGEIKVTSGRILACDPFIMGEDIPFAAIFPNGNFPVELSIAKKAGDERVAYARILFSKNKAIRWELALIGGRDTSELKDKIIGYGVDSGVGSFMDMKAYAKLDSISRVDSTVYKSMMKDWKKNYRDTRGWCIYHVDGENLVIFSAGYGDGLYKTLIGYDSEGEICCLLTDFELINLGNK